MTFLTYTIGAHTFPVIDSREWDVPVCSDNAMIDDGRRAECTLWVPQLGVTHVVGGTPDGETWGFNHDPEAVAAAKAYTDAVRSITRFVRDARERVRKCEYEAIRRPRKGDAVEVFKGRKVPKGTYTVTMVGTGNYGTYFDLRGGDGRSYRYVSPDNVRLPNLPAPTFEDVPAEFRPMVEELAKLLDGDPDQRVHYAVIADQLEERGDPRARHFRAWLEWEILTPSWERKAKLEALPPPETAETAATWGWGW